ncbi:MAG: transposase [Actinobacteria bacterium]|nr:transposase [Actinomycetota bacterium]
MADHDVDPDEVAGVDVGIIHLFAAATDDAALVVSGRALRAKERLHLDDSRQRGKHLGRKAPKRGQRGSRRYKQLRARQRKAETRHRRRVRQPHHQAAKRVIEFAVSERVGTLVVGDPKGITDRDIGAVGNWRLRAWRRTHLMAALADKAAAAGIRLVTVDERGTSSSCPDCGRRVPNPSGRILTCPHCGHRGHRDIAGARNCMNSRELAGDGGWMDGASSWNQPPEAAGSSALRCGSSTVEQAPLHGVTGADTCTMSAVGLAGLRAAHPQPAWMGVARPHGEDHGREKHFRDGALGWHRQEGHTCGCDALPRG